MKRTTKIRLAIIVPGLALIGWGSWYGVNMLVARQLPLIHLVEIGDVDGVEYVSRWDSSQTDQCRRLYPDAAPLDPLTADLAALNAALRVGTAEDYTPLILAVKRRDAMTIRVLLKNGADPNGPTNDPDLPSRPLGVAARTDAVVAARILLEYGADVNATSIGIPRDLDAPGIGQITPLDEAESIAMRALLEEHGGKTRKDLGLPVEIL